MTSADDPKSPRGESREMYPEIAGLVASLAKAFAVSEAEIVTALEQGTLALGFHQDENGNRFVAASFDGRQARVYQGAIKRSG
jgi:hypothetical protein